MRRALVQQGADPQAGRLAGGQHPEQVGEGQAGVDDVLHHQDVGPGQVQVEVLLDRTTPVSSEASKREIAMKSTRHGIAAHQVGQEHHPTPAPTPGSAQPPGSPPAARPPAPPPAPARPPGPGSRTPAVPGSVPRRPGPLVFPAARVRRRVAEWAAGGGHGGRAGGTGRSRAPAPGGHRAHAHDRSRGEGRPGGPPDRRRPPAHRSPSGRSRRWWGSGRAVEVGLGPVPGSPDQAHPDQPPLPAREQGRLAPGAARQTGGSGGPGRAGPGGPGRRRRWWSGARPDDRGRPTPAGRGRPGGPGRTWRSRVRTAPGRRRRRWGLERDRDQAAATAAGRGDQAASGPVGEAGLAPDRPPVGAEQLVRGDKSTKRQRST